MNNLKERIIEDFTYTVGNKNEVNDIVRILLIIQRVFGQQILDPRWTWRKFFLRHLAAGASWVYVMIGTIHILRNTKEIDIVAEASYTIVIAISYATKYFIFLNSRFLLRKLFIDWKSTLYDAIKENSLQTFNGHVKKAKMGVNLMFLMLFAIPIYIMKTLWFYVQGDFRTMSRTTSTLTPMKTPYFEIACVIHAIFMFEAGFIILATDLWCVLLMNSFCLACDSTLKILAVKRQPNESKTDYAIRLNNSLRSFYKIHVKLVDFLNTLNAAFKWLIVVPLFNVSMGACLILLLFTKGVDWTFMSHVFPTVGELIGYNLFGEQLKSKANDWKMSLLNFDWRNLRTKDMKNYCIMILYMQKNFAVTTAIGNDLSFITMSSVLKVSYQAFTVLQTMDG